MGASKDQTTRAFNDTYGKNRKLKLGVYTKLEGGPGSETMPPLTTIQPAKRNESAPSLITWLTTLTEKLLFLHCGKEPGQTKKT